MKYKDQGFPNEITEAIMVQFIKPIFSDDFVEVRTDIILNEMIPSEQRATLISVNSFMFSLIMIVMSTLMGSIM